MKINKITAALLAVIMLCLVAFTGCSDTKEMTTADTITNVPEETVLKVTADMTRKQLYELFGDTYGQQATGQNAFLATYIIADKYIYSVSVFNDDTSDSPLGYDGQALLNSLKNSRTLTTQREMTVSAEDDLKTEKAADGFKVTVDYSGKYTAYMNGYEVSVKGKVIDQKQQLSGKKVLSVNVLNPVDNATEQATTVVGTTAADTTAKEAKSTKSSLKTSAKGAVKAAMAPAGETTVAEDAVVLAAPAGTEETTAEKKAATVSVPDADGVSSSTGNVLLGLLEIRNDAQEVVYVEIYQTASGYISRVRQ